MQENESATAAADLEVTAEEQAILDKRRHALAEIEKAESYKSLAEPLRQQAAEQLHRVMLASAEHSRLKIEADRAARAYAKSQKFINILSDVLPPKFKQALDAKAKAMIDLNYELATLQRTVDHWLSQLRIDPRPEERAKLKKAEAARDAKLAEIETCQSELAAMRRRAKSELWPEV